MPNPRPPIEFTQTQSPADEARSKDLSLARTKPPAEVPGYQVTRFLGAGAYGEVWAGQNKNTSRKVAIKFYAHRRGVDWSLLDREVEKLVFLSADRYVVQLLEVGWNADPPFYVMEYVENGSLEDLLHQRGTFSATDATEMFREIGIGLVHAHGRGVLHCDLKPANVLIDQDGKPRLADFGQSRLSHEQKPALGTLFYMAPEQADLKAVPDARWDVYALGAIFYCLLIGRPPHRHDHSVSHIETATDLEDRLARYREIIEQTPVPQEHRKIRGVDGRLAEIIERCLAANPDDRFANVQEVLDALVNRERARARQKMMAVGLIGPLLVLIIAAVFSWRGYQGAVRDTEAGYRQRALENNEFAARLAAEKVTSEIGKYFIIVKSEALEPELHDQLEPLFSGPGLTETSQLMQKLQDPKSDEAEKKRTRDLFLSHAARKELHQYLQHRLDIYLAAVHEDRHAPKFASVFVLDRWGNQLAVAFDDPKTPGTTVGLNVAYRSYFHGGASDAAEKLHPPEAGKVPHIVEVQLSAIFKSSSQKTWKVAVSTPIYRDAARKEFIGVLVYTINVGDFAFFRLENEIAAEHYAVLVDGRPGPSRGSILQHPLFIDLAKGGQKPPEEIISMRVPQEVLDTKGDRLYTDPLGEHPLGREKYGQTWVAAVASVRAPSVPGVAYDPKTEDTGLDVLVQSSYANVISPVHELSERLLRNIVLMLAVVVITGVGVWALALRVFREPKHPRLAPPKAKGDDSSPLHGMSTLAAPEGVDMVGDTDDTIAAIASAAGGAYRGIIRVSGPKCLECIQQVFEPTDELRQLSHIRQPSLLAGNITLPALGTFLPATLYLWSTSRSYTRQPTAELHTLGSPPLLEAVLAEVCRHGARLARPGEFTLRAFLAGRMDLTQAEAVLGVIDAGSEKQLQAALSQLAGGIGGPLAAVRGSLLDLLAHLEAGLDFVDEDIEFISREHLLAELRAAFQHIEDVARQMHTRGAAGNIPRVVLCGAPNAGKSSLLNALVGEDVAMVSSVAGTTRDFVSRRVRWEGMEIELVDTAGLDDSPAGSIAAQAQSAAQASLENCDLQLWCGDAAAGENNGPVRVSQIPVLHILTKCDLAGLTRSVRSTFLATSSRTGEGVAELRRRIAAELASPPGDAVASTAARCRESLTLAALALQRAISAGEAQAGEEFVAAEVRAALDDLGQVLGTVYTEDILDRIFSRFCIGK